MTLTQRTGLLEKPPETGSDWSSDDTALEIQFKMETGKNAFQKTCRDMYTFVMQGSF